MYLKRAVAKFTSKTLRQIDLKGSVRFLDLVLGTALRVSEQKRIMYPFCK